MAKHTDPDDDEGTTTPKDGKTGEQPVASSITVTEAEASAMADCFEKLGETEETTVDRGTHDKVNLLVVADGRRVVDVRKIMERYRQFPERKRGTAVLTTLDSMIRHTQRFRDDDSVVFVDTSDPSNPKMVSFLDYNRTSAAGQARHGEHRGVYNFPLSDEWKAWFGKNTDKNAMDQQAFATFLEDRVLDICSPDRATAGSLAEQIAAHLTIKWASPQKIMELSRGIEVNSGAQQAEFIDNKLGTRQVAYKDVHTGANGAPLDIPGGFLIRIPIFKGDDPFVIPVQLRFRPKSMKWFFEMFRPDKHLEMAVNESVNKLVAATGVFVLDGTAEHASRDYERMLTQDKEAD